MLLALLTLLCAPAHALGGLLAGPEGEEAPLSDGTQVAIARHQGKTTLTVTARVARQATDLALIWPVEPSLEVEKLVAVPPAWFSRIESTTRARVEEVTCDEVVVVEHQPTPPGCASYEVEEPEVLVGEDAVDDLPLEGAYREWELELDVLPADALEGWLSDRGLVTPASLAEALAVHVEAGDSFVVARPSGVVPVGEWMPPFQMRWAGTDDVTLPLTLGSGEASGLHELVVYGLTSEAEGDLVIPNFPEGVIERECMLPEGAALDTWVDDRVTELGIELPTWIEVYAGAADRCDPCTDDPLLSFEAGDLGWEGDAADAWLTRLQMRYAPGNLDQDPLVVPSGVAAPAQLRFVAYEHGLEFGWPVCGEGLASDPGVCEGLRPDPAGCAWSGAPVAPVLLLPVLLVLARRRRAVAGAVLAAALALPVEARALDPQEPLWELHAAYALMSTDRVVIEGFDEGGPSLLQPFVGLEARRGLIGWKRSASLGVMGGVRGFSNKAGLGAQGPVRFSLLDLHAGVDVRHGRFREAGFSPRFRYGAQLVGSTLDSSAWRPRTTASLMFHTGVGAWLGRGTRRPSLELRGSLIPRTDGYVTRFEPHVGLPGWTFFPGSANLQLVFGLGIL